MNPVGRRCAERMWHGFDFIRAELELPVSGNSLNPFKCYPDGSQIGIWYGYLGDNWVCLFLSIHRIHLKVSTMCHCCENRLWIIMGLTFCLGNCKCLFLMTHWIHLKLVTMGQKRITRSMSTSDKVYLFLSSHWIHLKVNTFERWGLYKQTMKWVWLSVVGNETIRFRWLAESIWK